MLAPSICLVDIDTRTPVADIIRAAAALHRQVNEHWAPAWGTLASVRAATPSAPPRRGEIQVQLRRVPGPNQSGALALHDETPDGLPIAYVFPLLCAQEGETWTSAASHEILELLGDPRLNLMAQLPDGRICAIESCDQVQNDLYEIDGVVVSNFNTPANFSPPKHTAGVKWDYLGHAKTWFQILPGGYAQVYDQKSGWKQLGQAQGYRARVADLGLGRSGKRQMSALRTLPWWRRTLNRLV